MRIANSLSGAAFVLGAGLLSALFSGCGAGKLGDEGPSTLPADPLRTTAESPSGLTDVSSDLEALLEHGALAGACAKMQPGDRASRLLCGKSMFFYESFETMGVPLSLAQFLLENFSAELGSGFEKLGMVPDPRSTQHLPLGLAPTAKLAGKVDALAYTCASCHFGRLPDGRYAVGAPNERYEYGKQFLALAVFPGVALNGAMGHDPKVVSAIQPLLSHYQADSSLNGKLILALLPLVLGGVTAPMVTAEVESKYAAWKSGTMDFLIEPLPTNDGVHTVSKIPPLWELPNPQEVAASGMVNELLGWTGNTPSLMSFCSGFVWFGAGKPAAWPNERLAPLAEYIYALRRPQNPSPPDAAQVAAGRRLFVTRDCLSCHDGPRGSGKRVYTYDEIGTDAAMKRWLDPTLSGSACCMAPVSAEYRLTHAIKSPRIVGNWALSRFLHNGSVDTLERLFCLDGARPSRSDEPFGDQGHMQTCDGLSVDEKQALIAYLRAN